MRRFKFHFQYLIDLFAIAVRTRKLCAPNSFESARLEHCVKLFDETTPMHLRLETIQELSPFRQSSYSLDLIRCMWLRDQVDSFAYRFGDVVEVPDYPTFVKSRPIHADNANACLLPLNTFRHFPKYIDPTSFRSKSDSVVWRGAAYQPWRKIAIDVAKKLPFCDVADTDSRESFDKERKYFLTPQQQMSHKFILSIEGNDVASNLKWAMASNSVVMMRKPRFETWFCESWLQPGRHFIELSDDFSSLPDQYEYYVTRPKLCEEIIREANAYAAPFYERFRQFELGSMAIGRYVDRLNALCEGRSKVACR